MCRTERLRAAILIAASLTLALHAQDTATTARAILTQADLSGGLIVHLGCGNGALTASLRPSDACIVHGLDAAPASVQLARHHIRSLGRYGPISVDRLRSSQLPYADNLVNLLVVSDDCGVGKDEMFRVLAPGGVLLATNPESEIANQKFTKLIPDGIDAWSHFLHDPTNNAVAHDRVVGPPGRVQWTAGPVWSREHDVTPDVFAPVSAGGRLFYILNEDPTCTIGKDVPDNWSLVARDAFNGIMLWKHPIPDWYSSRVIWGHIPVSSMRRLVADGDYVYVTLGLQAPVTVLDAATGVPVREYAGTEQTGEIVCSGGRMALVTRRTHALDGLLAGRDGNRFRKGFTGPQEGGDELLVVDQETGQCLWRSPHHPMPLTLAVTGDNVLFAEADAIVCLDIGTGTEKWRTPFASARTLVASDQTVLVGTADRKKITLAALDLNTGRELWRRNGDALPNFVFFFAPLDIFVAQGLVWGLAEGLEWDKKPGSGQLLGVDPRTGQTRRKIPLTGAFTTEHHVRCYKGKATDDFLLFNKRGIEFIPLAEGATSVPNSYQWVRGVCRYGILPCNGLIYAPPQACACYPGAKLNGFFALSAGPPAWTAPLDSTPEPRLVRGPAYSKEPAPANRSTGSEWPTYRANARRSAHTAYPVPAALNVAWTDDAGGTRLTAPVVAEGKVLSAASDEYTLHAWGADDGRRLWSHVAGGRIDSPPTVHAGTALFGSRDGWVTCLRLADGMVMWRTRAAPRERLVGAFGRLESAWPVHGSVLVRDGTAYFAAGTSSFLDGGIHVYGVDAWTGEERFHTCLRGPDPQAPASRITSGRMPGAVPDILVGDDAGLTMRHVKLDWQLSAPPPEQFAWGVKGEKHLIAESGFLDNTMFNRTVWRYGIRIDRSQMLAIDGTDVYGVRVYEGISWNCPVHNVGDGHLVFRQDVSKPVPQPAPQEKKRLFRIPRERYAWQTRVPLRVRAMLLSGGPAQHLFIAGVPDRVDEGDDPLASIEGRAGASIVVLDASTGKQKAEIPLAASPVWDGMAAAYGRLYMTTTAGELLCLSKR